MGSALPPTLQATVGSGSISLKTSSGRAVMKLRAGVYVVVVHDKSRRQNFHLRGGKIDRTTTAAFVGIVRWRLRLTRGHYIFRSDRQDSLQGDFTVR